MSIITQALKKAQREQSSHRDRALPSQPTAASQPQHAMRRRGLWVLGSLGGVIALGVGFGFLISQPPTVATPVAMTAVVPQAITAIPKRSRLQSPSIQPAVSELVETVSPALMVPPQAETKQPLKSEPQQRLRLPTLSSPAPPTTVQTTQAQMRFRQALEAQKADDLTQTESLLLQTIALDPSFKEAYNSLGNIYYQRKKYQLAKSMYQQALEIDATYVKAHNNLGSTYMRLAMYAEAIAHLRQAISLDHHSGLAYYNLACVYARTSDETQAAQYLSQAIDRDPAARIWARTDTDFALVRTTPALQKLLGAS